MKLRIEVFFSGCRTYTLCVLESVERDPVSRRVGDSVIVRWCDGWYNGRLESYEPRRKIFLVLCDDGDDEELTLSLSSLSKNSEGCSKTA